uniref:C-terminal binding protein n=1 Tax=Micromonospora carbonacea TaxID=47853 RepID=A0A7D6C9K0_9ACTN|nr:C-terminal binding protein [Micromonospora carbonacea]
MTAAATPAVVYTDPAWGAPTVEEAVYGDAVRARIGPFRGPAALHEAVAGAAALIVYRCPVTPELLDAAGPQLRVVARQGVGTDNLNAALLGERGIVGFNVPDYCVDEVAAHTLAMVLAWERRLVPQHTGLTGGRFDIHHGGAPRRLGTRTAGIIGLGRIGRAVAARLRLFYQRVLAADPFVHADQMLGYGVRKTELPELLAESDVVLLHCPLDPDTRGLIDADALGRMRPDALLVNTARGGLVDAEALAHALTTGVIGGAALDVFVPEDPHRSDPYRRVLGLPNVLVSSHRAFYSAESELSSRQRVAEGVRQVLDTGRPPVTGHVAPSAAVVQPWAATP